MPELNEASDINVGDTPDTPVAANVHRFGPGFGWGLGVGTLAVVLILAAAYVTLQFVVLSRFTSRIGSPATTKVVVSPAKAGSPWFSVSADGRGTLQAWAAGSSGSGGDLNDPAGVVAFFDAGTLDIVNGVKITHMVRVNVTPKTEFVIGGQQYDKGKAASAADAIFNNDQGPYSDILTGRPLTIDFHREGDSIVADRVSAPLESSGNPIQF